MSWRGAVFSAILFFQFTGTVFAASCTTGTLDTYMALSSAGCTIGQLTFARFGFQTVSSSGGATAITPSQIMVTPTVSGGQYGLTYSSNAFSATAGQKIQYLLAYSIADPPIIHGFATAMKTDPPVFPGIASITSNECLGAEFTGSTCPGPTDSETVFSNGVVSSLSAEDFFPSVSLIDDQTTITLDASSGGSAEFQSFSESAVSSPEPAEALATGIALLMLLFRRRKS